MKKNKKEKILSLIVLKYYQTPNKTDNKEKSGIVCAWCLEKNIVNIGGGFYDEKGKAHQICENCAVLRYRHDYKIHSLAVARARRRRIFDIGYLFNEMMIDKYIKIKGIKDFSEIEAGFIDNIFIKGTELFNYLFCKEEKIKIEQIESQKDIENIFQKRLAIIDFKEYFKKLGM